MFGATKAAKAMAKRWEAEDRAKGRAEGEKAHRKATRERLEQIINRGGSLDELKQFRDELSGNSEQG